MKRLEDDVDTMRVYVKNAFDEIASTYDRSRRIWYEIISLIRNNKPNIYGFVADLGCGTGRNTIELARNDDVVGLDISLNMVSGLGMQ